MARKFVQLLPVEYLFERGMVDSNVDVKLINNHILTFQEIQIQTVLGNSLYVKIMELVYDGNISGKYLELLTDWVCPALAHGSVYTALPYLNYKFTNRSVTEQNSQFGNPTGLDNIKYLRDDLRNKYEFFLQRVREFIVNNPSDFPEYYTTSNIDSIHPKRTQYFNGLYLNRGTNCNVNDDWFPIID
jgi:hypothetical protein